MTNEQHHEGPLHLVLELPTHDELTELLQMVQDTEIPVRTADISAAGVSSETRVTVDLDTLTEKQRCTLELALEVGYYERPRESDLTALADELDISKSAVSQRLRTAEMKLIKHAFRLHS